MTEPFRAVPAGYGPRYSPFSQYAPEVPHAWDDPADEETERFGLWLPPGHAYPVLQSTPVCTETDAEEKTA